MGVAGEWGTGVAVDEVAGGAATEAPQRGVEAALAVGQEEAAGGAGFQAGGEAAAAVAFEAASD